ncbi:MAG: CRISPR-associated endonuclease Cas1 [Pyrodictiaceae archaeon]
MRIVFVAEPGSRIRVRKGGIYIVTKKGERIAVTPDVDHVIVASSGISISAKALRYLARYGVDLAILDSTGYPVARLYPPYINKTVATRIAQYERILKGFGTYIASEIVYSKIFNQAQLLKYLAKNYREPWLRDVGYEVEAIATDLRMKSPGEIDREKIMSIEAHAARKYWQALASILPGDLGFRGRDPDSTDLFNLALNYGYGILYNVCEKALLLAGLDPYLGILHVVKSGRPSLTLDFVEMFRAVAVDKPLVINARRLDLRALGDRLDYESRKMVAEVILSNLDTKYRCSKSNRIAPLRDHIKREAWDLARSFREGVKYKGFRVYL